MALLMARRRRRQSSSRRAHERPLAARQSMQSHLRKEAVEFMCQVARTPRHGSANWSVALLTKVVPVPIIEESDRKGAKDAPKARVPVAPHALPGACPVSTRRLLPAVSAAPASCHRRNQGLGVGAARGLHAGSSDGCCSTPSRAPHLACCNRSCHRVALFDRFALSVSQHVVKLGHGELKIYANRERSWEKCFSMQQTSWHHPRKCRCVDL